MTLAEKIKQEVDKIVPEQLKQKLVESYESFCANTDCQDWGGIVDDLQDEKNIKHSHEYCEETDLEEEEPDSDEESN